MKLVRYGRLGAERPGLVGLGHLIEQRAHRLLRDVVDDVEHVGGVEPIS